MQYSSKFWFFHLLDRWSNIQKLLLKVHGWGRPHPHPQKRWGTRLFCCPLHCGGNMPHPLQEPLPLPYPSQCLSVARQVRPTLACFCRAPYIQSCMPCAGVRACVCMFICVHLLRRDRCRACPKTHTRALPLVALMLPLGCSAYSSSYLL